MLNKVPRILTLTSRILYKASANQSANTELINVPPAKYANHRNELKQNIWRDVDVTGKRSETTHLSKSEQWIKKIPVIRVDHDVVRCIGGTAIGAGHPQVYIQVNTRHPGQPVSCKWCGLRYALNADHHH